MSHPITEVLKFRVWIISFTSAGVDGMKENWIPCFFSDLIAFILGWVSYLGTIF